MAKDYENGFSIKAHSDEKVPLLFSCRLTLFIVCMWTTFGFMIQRININFALVCMVNNNISMYTTNTSHQFTNNESDNNISLQLQEYSGTLEKMDAILIGSQNCQLQSTNKSLNFNEGEFEWSKDVQGALLASFYYGFVFTQIPGGWFCDRFGAKKAFLVTSTVFSSLSLLNPFAARLGSEYLFVTRLLQGFTNGASLPAINVLSARWCGAGERGFLLGIAYAGFSIASAFTYPISAFLCQYFGWPSIFYVTGTFGILFVIGAYFLIFDWPEKHPRIKITELQYLRKNRAVQYMNGKSKQLNVPWKNIFSSRAILALLITGFCCFWGFLTIVAYLPTFLKEVLHMDISQNGMYSSIPFIIMLIFHFIVGQVFDSFRKRNLCTLTNLRKIFNTLGMIVPAICLVSITFISCEDHIAAIFIISVGLGFIEFVFMGGYLFSVFEMAPRFAGVVTGASYTFSFLSGFLTPLAVGFMTKTGSREEWLNVFYVAAGFNVFGGLVYLFFGSCELQSWAVVPEENKEEIELKALQENLLNNTNANTRKYNGHV